MEDNWGGDIQGPMRSEEMAGYEDEINITACYRAVDGYHETRTFKTLKGAARFCSKWLGTQFESYRPNHGVTFDGIGVVDISGCPISLSELVAMAKDVEDEDQHPYDGPTVPLIGYEDEVPGDYNITGGEEDMNDYDRRPPEVAPECGLDIRTEKYPLTRIVLITPWELGHLKDEGGWDSIAHMLNPLSIADVLENGNVYADSGNELYEMYVVEDAEEFEVNGLRILGMDEPTKIIHNIKAWKTSGGSMYAMWHDFLG